MKPIMKKNNFLILASILILLVIGILLYGLLFQKQDPTQNRKETNEPYTVNPSNAISEQFVEPNGEEKVNNISMEFMQAGNFAQETENIQ